MARERRGHHLSGLGLRRQGSDASAEQLQQLEGAAEVAGSRARDGERLLLGQRHGLLGRRPLQRLRCVVVRDGVACYLRNPHRVQRILYILC